MKDYSVCILPQAIERIGLVDRRQLWNIVHAINRLEDAPPPGKRLKGDRTGIWCVTVGAVRVLYELREESILVISVAPSMTHPHQTDPSFKDIDTAPEITEINNAFIRTRPTPPWEIRWRRKVRRRHRQRRRNREVPIAVPPQSLPHHGDE